MATKLTKLRIGELTLCPEGANQGAKVVLMKMADPSKELNMPDDVKKVADLETQIAELTKSNEKLTADLAKMGKDCEAEKAGREKAEKDLGETKKAVDLAKSDEVIKLDDKTEIRKSVVGDAQFAIFKAMNDRAQAAEQKAEGAVFEKMAETVYKNLPGKPDEKGQVLKAIGKLEKSAADTLTAMLKAGDEAMAMAMTERGQSGQGIVKSGTPTGDLDDIAKSIKSKEPALTYEQAYAKGLDTPEGAAAYARMKAEQHRSNN